MNIDKYLDRIYNARTYNCAHFVCEVWKEFNNTNIEYALKGAMTGSRNRGLHAHRLDSLERVATPSGACLALFQANRKDPHVGIWIDGKILHITEMGVQWSPLEILMIRFNQVRFYNVKKNNHC